MPNDQPQVAESAPSVEDRLSAFFGGPAALKPEPPPAEEPVQSTDQPSDDQQIEEPVTDDQPVEEAAPELVDVEYNGKTFKVDPELREAVMLKADHTRKTQELAASRRTLEIEKAALQATQTFNQQIGELNTELSRLTALKEQAERIDRNSLTTDQRLDLDYELRKIDRQIGDLNGRISGERDAHRQRFSQMVVAAVAESEKFMAGKVPGWSVDTGRALHEYGLQLGIPTEKLTTGWFADPTATHVMWKAQQWDRLQASKPAVANKSAAAPPVAKPGSPAAQQSMAQATVQKMRQNLKKTGSVEAAAALIRRMK